MILSVLHISHLLQDITNVLEGIGLVSALFNENYSYFFNISQVNKKSKNTIQWKGSTVVRFDHAPLFLSGNFW